MKKSSILLMILGLFLATVSFSSYGAENDKTDYGGVELSIQDNLVPADLDLAKGPIPFEGIVLDNKLEYADKTYPLIPNQFATTSINRHIESDSYTVLSNRHSTSTPAVSYDNIDKQKFKSFKVFLW